MGNLWIIASILCLIAAGIFLLRENYDAAFALGAVGAVAWFLNYRSRVRGTIIEERETTDDEPDDSDDDE
jgi:uncharacterized membrane protein YhfC